MKRIITITTAILFLPACLVGFIIGCSKAGFDTGIEIARDYEEL